MRDWVWDGGRPSLDLLNTLRDRALEPRETLRSPADLAAWLREAGLLDDGSDVGEAALNTARRLRTAIDTLAFLTSGEAGTAAAANGEVAAADGEVMAADGEAGAADGEVAAAVAEINAIAERAPGGPRLALADGRPVAVSTPPSADSALGRVALDAIDLLTGDELLRVCAAHDCGIRFADRSPGRNRQWCSMRRCGNRTKARRHYARTR